VALQAIDAAETERPYHAKVERQLFDSTQRYIDKEDEI